MKVIIADNKENVRYGLRTLLEEQPQVERVLEAINFRDLLSLIVLDCPNLILLSWELSGQSGEILMKSMRLICPDVHIVVVSSQPGVAEIALKLGADDFVSKTDAPENLLKIIKKAFSVLPYNFPAVVENFKGCRFCIPKNTNIIFSFKIFPNICFKLIRTRRRIIQADLWGKARANYISFYWHYLNLF